MKGRCVAKKTRRRSQAFAALAGGGLLVVLAAPALAHHILGIPHYAYEDSYPQAPVIKYSVEAGPYVVELTGYPGRPVPGERAKMHAYLRARDGTDGPYQGPVRVRVVEGAHHGEDSSGVNIYGPETLMPENVFYVFCPTYPDDGIYTVKLAFEAEGQPFTISFPITVGEPISAWVPVAWGGAGLFFLLIVVRAIAIKRRRRLSRTARPEGASQATLEGA